MKRVKGILGASLAGFAALTMAAISTTATTEAIAFKGSRLRVQAPTQIRSVSNVQRRIPRAQSPTRVGRTMSEFSARRLSVPTAVKRSSTSNAATGAALIHSYHQPRPSADGNLAERYQDPTPRRRKRITNTVEGKPSTVSTIYVTPSGSSQVSGEQLFESRRAPVKLRDPRLDHLKKNFFEAIQGPQFTPIPEEIKGLHDPAKDRGRFGVGVHWDGESAYVGEHGSGGTGPEACRVPVGGSSEPSGGDPSGTSGGQGGSDSIIRVYHGDDGRVWFTSTDSDGETTKGYLGQDDDTGTSVGGNNTSVGGSYGGSGGSEPVKNEPQNDTGGEMPPADEAGSDDPEAEGGPNEIRDALKDQIVDVTGVEEASMGDGSPASAAAGWTGNPTATGGKCGLEIARDGVDGTNRNPEDGTDPAANPAVSAAAGININTSHAMSPTVDDRESGNGPSGPIGPVATESASASVDLGASLSAAMSDPMSNSMAPAVGGDGKSNPPGPIEPVADHSRVRDHIR